MNSYLKEALLKQKLKVEVKNLLNRKPKQKLVGESSLYKAFVEPFTDVLQSVNLAGQDFLNSYITFLRMFITFNPEKHKELIQKHDERKAKIAEKWKPLMDRTDEALSTGDADIVALALAPHVWAVSAVGSAAAEYGGGAASFLSNVGLGGLVSIAAPSFVGLSDYIPSDFEGDKDSSILDKMGTLFLGGVVATTAVKSAKDALAKAPKNESVLKEQAKKPDLRKDLETFFEDTGLMEKAEEDAKELFESLKEMVKSIDEEYETKRQMFEGLKNSDNFEDFNKALDVSDSLNDSDGIDQEAQETKKEMKKSVDDLVKSDKFIQQVKKETSEDEVSNEDLRKAAEKVVFLEAKKNMESELGGFDQGIDQFGASIGEYLKEQMPSDAAMNILKKSNSPISNELVKFVEKTKQKFSIT